MSGKEPSPPKDWGTPAKPLDKVEVVNDAPAKASDSEVIVNPAEEH